MKKSLYRRLAIVGTALILSAFPVSSASAATFSGNLESVSEGRIAGWAWDKEDPETPVTVELTLAGEGGPGDYSLVTLTASKARPDLKKTLDSTNHGFSFLIDWDSYTGKTFVVTAAVVSGEERIPLEGSFTYKKGDAEGVPVKKPETEETLSSSSKDTVIGEGGPGYVTVSQTTETGAKSREAGLPEDGQPTTLAAETGEKGEFLGSFIASGYCNCKICSGGHNFTYAGTVPQANHTIAANLDKFPLGTKLMIDDVVYTVEDTGSGVESNRLDIFFSTHEEALAYGLQTVDVYSVKQP